LWKAAAKVAAARERELNDRLEREMDHVVGKALRQK
jgi:hypothetical protein